jgi:hypothetical protein
MDSVFVTIQPKKWRVLAFLEHTSGKVDGDLRYTKMSIAEFTP